MMQRKSHILFNVPLELSNEADFAVPVALTRSVHTKYVEVDYLTAEEQMRFLRHILWDARKEIDCWWGEDNDMDRFDVQCLVPRGRHICCGTLCTSYADFKAVYSRDEAGEVLLVISIPEEA